MDGTAAISSNIEALKGILAGLVSMAALKGEVVIPGFTLPRYLRLAILRLLRPAESAARRLIIASARGLVVALPPPRERKPKPVTMEPQLRRFGIAVVMPPADLAAAVILPRLRGRGTTEGGGGGGPGAMPLPLFDPPRRIRLSAVSNRAVPAHAAPRISFPGATVAPDMSAAGEPRRVLPLPSPDDPIDATRLSLRLAALAAALDDLPGQARRFARWKARHDIRRKSPAHGRIRRISPLRPGRPFGGRLSRFDPSATRGRNIREVDEVLAHAHALALYALESPDTS
jgi:hypothetical protein